MTFLEQAVAQKVEEVKERKALREQDMRAEAIGKIVLGILELYGEFADDGEEVKCVELKKVKRFPSRREPQYELCFCACTENHRIDHTSISQNETVKQDKIIKKLRSIDGTILSSAEIGCLSQALSPYCIRTGISDGFLFEFNF